MTSGSRGSGWERRGAEGEATADWCARLIHSNTMDYGRAHLGSLHPSLAAIPQLLFSPRGSPHYSTPGALLLEPWVPSRPGCSRRK